MGDIDCVGDYMWQDCKENCGDQIVAFQVTQSVEGNGEDCVDENGVMLEGTTERCTSGKGNCTDDSTYIPPRLPNPSEDVRSRFFWYYWIGGMMLNPIIAESFLSEIYKPVSPELREIILIPFASLVLSFALRCFLLYVDLSDYIPVVYSLANGGTQEDGNAGDIPFSKNQTFVSYGTTFILSLIILFIILFCIFVYQRR